MARVKPATTDTRLDWLLRDRHVIDGLDHLGIEVVSVNLYTLLVPGITNVTDRVRYHTFYPWVLDRFAQEKARGRQAWRNWIRSLDFALVLSSVAHERHVDETESAIVGAFTARRRLRNVDDGDQMVDFASLVEVDEKGHVPNNAYFQHAEGGFGQYYKGAGGEMGLFLEAPGAKDPDRILTNYAGVPAARCARTVFEPLLDIARARKCSLRDLAKTGAVVSPSAIVEGSHEERFLRELVLEGESDVTKGQDPRSRDRRRNTILAALSYVAACAASDENPARESLPYEFRWACHARRLPDGDSWKVATSLEDVVVAWGSYQRNDVMNYALEVLHWALLRRLEEVRRRPERLAADVAAAACGAIADDGDSGSLPALRGSVERWLAACARAPREEAAEPWGMSSTWAWFTNMEAAQADGDEDSAVRWAVRLLGRLATDRGPVRTSPFETLAGADDMASGHDVHYGRWLSRTRERANESVSAFLVDLFLEWILFRHLRVATRKLASQGVSTFKFRPEEGELVLVADAPQPTLTTPRLRQVFRFLEDLHYVRREEGSLVVTPAGHALLRGLR